MSCKASSRYDFSVKQGSAKTVFLRWSSEVEQDSDGNIVERVPVDITNSNILIEFKRKNQYSSDPLIELSTENGGVVINDGPNGQFFFTLRPSDTAQIAALELGYDIRIELGGDPNRVSYIVEGVMKIQKTYTDLPELSPPQYTNLGYVLFDGLSRMSFVDSSPLANVVSWDHSWTVGFRVAADWPAGSQDMVFISNGGNQIRIKKENAKILIRAVASNTIIGTGQRFDTGLLSQGDPVVFVHDHVEEKLRLYVNGVEQIEISTSSAVDSANGTVVISGQSAALPLEGGMDDLFFIGRAITMFEVGEISFGQDPSGWTFYQDVIDFMLMGEDVIPQVKGLKENLEGVMQPPNPDLFVLY